MTLGEMMARKRRRSSIEKKITNIVKNNQRQHLTLSTADKQEIYKNLVTSAGYLGSSEHCLMLAMLQHTGLDDVASKSQNHFRSNYLKFLIAIKNDPELKLNYMETVGGQVAFLTGNKEDATLQKDMQKLDDFFLSLAQARKSRAGKTFETIIRLLFEKLEIPHSYQPVVNGRPDFIVPGKEEYIRAPQDTIVVTAKRTVRERWRQITTEGARGYRFFLATIDRNISGTTLNEMAQNQVTLIIPQAIIDEKTVYQNHSVIKNYKDLFDSIIPHSLESFGLLE